jgi:hypothetical protein
MNDLLDHLRALNPVDADTVEIPARLADRVLRPGRAPRRTTRRLRVSLCGLALTGAICVVVLLLPSGRAGTPDLAARAYAATAGDAIVHWRTEQFSFSNGRETDHQRSEGWARGGVTHIARYEVRHADARLVDDTATANGRTRVYSSGTDDYTAFPAVKGQPVSPLSGGDPFANFRKAYRAGRLKQVGPHRYAVELSGFDDSGVSAVYDLDPATALPRTFTLDTTTSDAGRHYANRLELRFTTYEQLPLTAANDAKLRLFPHPGAGPKDDPPARHFTVLRGDQRPGPGAQRLIAAIVAPNNHLALDAAGARAISPGHYLIPGRGYVCLAVRATQGFGTVCATVAQAVRHGVGAGTPAAGITVAVPDGVKALRARLHGGRSATVTVRGNGAMLPPGTYDWVFVKSAAARR